MGSFVNKDRKHEFKFIDSSWTYNNYKTNKNIFPQQLQENIKFISPLNIQHLKVIGNDTAIYKAFVSEISKISNVHDILDTRGVGIR